MVKAQTVSREYQVKAAFLHHFVEFTEWPTNTFSNTNSPIVIGILGTDPFGHVLDETVRGETVRGHPLIIQRYKHVGEIKDCHVLFISRSESGRLRKIIDRLKDRNILTVSDNEGFAQDGGMIEFFTEHGRIRLAICMDAAKFARLTISSKLLRLADIVTAERN